MTNQTQVTAQAQQVDFAAIKQRQRQTWGSGDYDKVAVHIVITSELLCEAVDLHAGQEVLDVACGSGNTAIAAARRFCRVTGVDYVPSLLERARARAEFERLDITFKEGDAEALAFPDASFDAVLSTFGTMFTPNQKKTASEMARVCRHGGKIGLATWTPTGYIGELFRITGRYIPSPPGVKPPVLWGTEERLHELFGAAAASINVTRRFFVFRFLSADHWIEFFRTNYGPTLKAFAALDDAGKEALDNDIRALEERYNRSSDGTMLIPSEYLEVVITMR
jgi:SAM-dependent methyltransferase